MGRLAVLGSIACLVLGCGDPDGRAGGTFSHNLNTAAQRGISVAPLRILAITGQIPHDAWYAGPAADPTVTKELREALLSLDPQREFGTPTVGASERISGFNLPVD